jgi:hypothetical protein
VAILAWFEEADKPFSDIRMDATLLIEEGDTVVAEYTWRATNTGPIARLDGTEIPASGKTVELPGVSVITVRDGRIPPSGTTSTRLDLCPNCGSYPARRDLPAASPAHPHDGAHLLYSVALVGLVARLPAVATTRSPDPQA